ncbi:hypothetical protein MPER_00911, partial [Moniliophthora perniciosa FA553]
LVRYPDIPGLDTFKGHIFHSGAWNHSVDLKGKRVACGQRFFCIADDTCDGQRFLNEDHKFLSNPKLVPAPNMDVQVSTVLHEALPLVELLESNAPAGST